ncbi:MAG: 3-isopropylmalate dehydrogenase [Lachnospiraceae bacterium]|nr:3-isopropylmalate dehydrogenase [Lachnospiraceae bacterium]MEE0687063.1 3-isopropylmalate dehydrogenase [Lachnospiraceae bacterium]MEE0862273.1 3-isopropylmalate dehydrogenase [Lachnospiraceae bacterium]
MTEKNKKEQRVVDEEGNLLQWHPAFYAGIQIELENELDKLIFESEHNLSKKPMRIDVLIIKKLADDAIYKNIGRIFRRYNIVEYKSPTDYLSIDDFYKVYGYSCFYKSEAKRVDSIKITDITITFVSKKYPIELIEHLEKIRCFGLEKVDEGIYYITNDTLPMQLLVTSELSKEENLWLKCLTNDLDDIETIDRLSKEYGAHEHEELYKAVMDVIVRANKEKFKEVTNMCEALREIWAEDFEQARNEGIELGYVKGVIESGKELGASREKVFKLVQEKFSLTSEATEENMKLYW